MVGFRGHKCHTCAVRRVPRWGCVGRGPGGGAEGRPLGGRAYHKTIQLHQIQQMHKASLSYTRCTIATPGAPQQHHVHHGYTRCTTDTPGAPQLHQVHHSSTRCTIAIPGAQGRPKPYQVYKVRLSFTSCTR